MKVAVTLAVNGVAYPVEIDPGASLLDTVRDVVGLTGSKEGCDDSECGACMMLLDGKPVNACSYLALQTQGREITTVEGLARGEDLHPLQAAFLEHGGVQCGFCTPGMLISAVALLHAIPQSVRGRGPDRALRQPLSVHRLRRHRQGRTSGGGLERGRLTDPSTTRAVTGTLVLTAPRS